MCFLLHAGRDIDTVQTGDDVPAHFSSLLGESLTPFKLETMYPLIYAGDTKVPDTSTKSTTGLCLNGTLSPSLVQGKIVLCLGGYSYNVEKGLEVKELVGLNSYCKTVLVAWEFLLMLVYFLEQWCFTIQNYIRTTWSEASSPTKLADDHRVVKYNIDSGTSMFRTHVAAAAALTKAVHPDWSSTAIRSTLMTTGTNNNVGAPITDAMGNPASSFHYRSGHFQTAKAIDPGLVYDDYLLFLCTTGASKLNPSFQCPNQFPSPNNLNYPSLATARLQGMVTVNSQ
ncbi:subtilisin-like serine endopeptidase family protein [Actinidia rufa]|uniref:Subtilisin-like serine endopeptidase family protein n=1 Tax=Actinidia rufa TaxID=165716 RepID=A0A7J0ERR1_9ERIC|nr:subtilisin-like serine endopeptidase family protein [Actinidia rufa]